MIDLIFDLLYVFYWAVETLWVYGAIALFLWGLFHIFVGTSTDKPYVSPWKRESLDFDNISGDEENNVNKDQRPLNW